MIAFTILGQPQSKANSRRLVKFGDKLASVKSVEALKWESDALRQIPPRHRVRLEGPVSVTMRIFYASERPDLDESLVLDVLQDRKGKELDPKTGKRAIIQSGVYRNDRQVREKHIFHHIDRSNPRVEIEIAPVQAQQVDLFSDADDDDEFDDPFKVEKPSKLTRADDERFGLRV